MKKSLIALAVLAASGAAMAQSSVTLYGIADIWFGSSKVQELNGAGVLVGERQTVLESGGVNGSRFGFKGTEDLGGGLKANFQLEQGFKLDSGNAADATKAFSRQAWVGLSGGFGQTKFGFVDTPYDDVRGANNNTFDSALTAAGVIGQQIGYSDTPSNTVYYASPSMGGFQGAVSYSLGEDKTATESAGKVLSLNVQYAAGPFSALFAHQTEKGGFTSKTAALESVADIAGYAGPLNAVYLGDKAVYNLVSGSYDLGAAKLLASYEIAKFSVDFINGDIKVKDLQLGVDVPLSSSMTLAVGYAQGKAEVNGTEFYSTRAYSAAVAYSLSKRTTVYAGFNNSKGTEEINNVTSDKSTTLALGLNHKF